MMRLSATFLQRRASRMADAKRCGRIASSLNNVPAMPSALLNRMHALSSMHWMSTQHGGVGQLSMLEWQRIYQNGNTMGQEANRITAQKAEDNVTRLLNEQSQQLATKLRQMITKGDRLVAWELFDAAKASGTADVLHWSMMLKLCNTSTERRRMMEEMVKAGLKLTDVTYGILIKQLMLEGKYIEARAVEEIEMSSSAIIPSKQTQSLFVLPEHKWNKMRMEHLQYLIETHSVEQAHEFYEELETNKVFSTADVLHWSMMVKLCDSSLQRRRMMEEMVKAEETWSKLRSEETWSKLRSRRLLELFKSDTPEARQKAHTFFEVLKASGAASVFRWNLMQRQCNTSEERRSMMGEMVKAGVQPTAASYHVLTNQLMIEGKYEEARVVVETEMPATGVVSDDYMHALFEWTEDKWSKMKTMHLQGLL
jgi:hypothetical protein